MIDFEWTPTTEARYDEMLCILPPAIMERGGFLVGEPATHRVCSVTGHVRPAFAAFVSMGADVFEQKMYGWRHEFFEASEPLTIPEFRAARGPRRIHPPIAGAA